MLLPLTKLCVDNWVVTSVENIARDFPAEPLRNPTPVLCPKSKCVIVVKGKGCLSGQ